MAKLKMKNRIINYIRTWSFMRLVRLVLGLIILVQGIMTLETLSIILGGVFAGMAVVNIGCNGSCPVNSIGNINKNETEFDEVVIKK